MRLRGLLETALYVDDLDAAVEFYRDILGLEVYSLQPGRHAFFRCGTGMFLLFNADNTSMANVEINGVLLPLHGSRGPGHAAFRVHQDECAAWRARLQQAGVAIEAEVSWPTGGESIYFRDPAGNSLELATPALWGLSEQE